MSGLRWAGKTTEKIAEPLLGIEVSANTVARLLNEMGFSLKTNAGDPRLRGRCHDRWWRTRGSKDYPDAERLLILADSGGANSARSRVWKCDLQQKIGNRHGLSVTVHHYPPGASKWNLTGSAKFGPRAM
jgi:hypothetical protein